MVKISTITAVLIEKKAMKSKIYRRFITTIALPSLLLALTFIASVPTYSVQATGGNETGATLATSGT
jgi:hypothetical protein